MAEVCDHEINFRISAHTILLEPAQIFFVFAHFPCNTMVKGIRSSISTLMRIFLTECGHKDVERTH